MTDNTQPTNRVFKIGSVRIVEDDSLRGKSPSEVQQFLAPLYPQIENATVRERTDEASGVTEITYHAAPGCKG